MINNDSDIIRRWYFIIKFVHSRVGKRKKINVKHETYKTYNHQNDFYCFNIISLYNNT